MRIRLLLAAFLAAQPIAPLRHAGAQSVPVEFAAACVNYYAEGGNMDVDPDDSELICACVARSFDDDAILDFITRMYSESSDAFVDDYPDGRELYRRAGEVIAQCEL